MIIRHSLLLTALITIHETSSELPRPRGVSISRAPLYNPSKDFTCLDQSLTIPFSQVNDDYCDCPDSSDEPGTSACPQGTFHCTNAGFKPLNIASSRVNDGICDCCDATDEYSTSKCTNVCKEMGRSAREEAQRKADVLKAGKQLKAELSEAGQKIKQERKEKLAELEKLKAEAERVLQEKEDLKKGVEELESAALEQYKIIEEEEKERRAAEDKAKNEAEATDVFNKYDSNGDGLIDVNELKTRQTFDKDRNGEVSEEEAKFFLNDKNAVNLEEFQSEAWANIKPYLMMESGLFKAPVGEGTVEEVTERPEEDFDEGHHEDQANDSHLDDEEEEEEEEEVQQEEPEAASGVVYDEETQKLIDQATQARNDFNDAEKAVKNIETEISDIEEYFKKDFGPDESFAALSGQCFDYTDYEYVYKLCPFDRATQQAKSGGVDTRLGSWSGWTGPGGNRYVSMMYDRGQSCWNGPQRSAHVMVSCGSENKLTAVSEPNRCEYLFQFTTPAACYEVPDEHHEDAHDEL